jgi:hypothetical protein
MGLALAESTNLLISPTKTLPGCPNDIQRRNLLAFGTGCLVGVIIHFEILNFCISSALEKNVLPQVIPAEISTTKISRKSGKCTLLSLDKEDITSTLNKENHML